jgi:ubiquinone/menaquinone biosynthesis C-methylase UbiE
MDGQNAPAAPQQTLANFSLKDEIRAYWAKRSETFDLSWGHAIRTEAERDGWAELFVRYGGLGPGMRVLELASGTGEVTRVLGHIGCTIDAIDLCEPMIERARTKPGNAAVRFHLGDAENTMMPDATYDAVVCRHLVWTLVDPAAAFADWFRVLNPGGVLLIADGDWVTVTPRARLLRSLSTLLDRLNGAQPLWDADAHARIVGRVHFRGGLRAPDLEAMLRAAGFEAVTTGPLDTIRSHQWRSASWSERLRLLATYAGHTFIMAARKPGP